MHVAHEPNTRISLTDQFRRVNGANLSPSVEAPVISADVSASGQDTELQFPQGSYVFTELDLTEILMQSDSDLHSDLNSLAAEMGFDDLLSRAPQEFQDSNSDLSRTELLGGLLGAMLERGESAISLNENDKSDRPLINIGGATPNEIAFAEFLNVPDASYFNVPNAYIDAIQGYIVGHEIQHTVNDTHHAHGGTFDSLHVTMVNEILADHNSLRSHFNSDFNNFIMDARAVSSLQYSNNMDAHATHIWREEFDENRMPTVTEAEQMAAAPRAIQEHALHSISADPVERMKLREEFGSDPISRYAHYKVLHEQGAFNDIPFANEFVDKYLQGAERIYAPERMEAFDIEALRERLTAPVTETVIAADQRQTMTAPAIGGM